MVLFASELEQCVPTEKAYGMRMGQIWSAVGIFSRFSCHDHAGKCAIVNLAALISSFIWLSSR